MDTIYMLECALVAARREGNAFLVYLIGLALAEAWSHIDESAQKPESKHYH